MATDHPDRPLADERFRLATRAAQLGIVDVHLPQKTLDIDARARELLALEDTRALEVWPQLLERAHEGDRERIASAFEAAFVDAAPVDVTFRVVAGGNVVRHLRAQVGGERAAEPRSRAVVSLVDVTQSTIDQNALRASEQRFRGAFQYSAMGIALLSPKGEWLQVNPALCDLFGYEEAELKRMTFQDVTHPDDLAADLALVTDVLEGRITHYHMEKRYFHKRGTLVWVLLSVSMVRDEHGSPLHFLSLLQDISERKRAQAELEASLREKETLIKEIHHRVKNNMQVISSILRLQSRSIADPAHRAVFDECRDRIQTMALVHERLYRATNLATLNFGEHLREISQLSRSTQNVLDERIDVSFDVDDIEMGVDTAIPLGLIANELVSNAYKHAFVDRPGGQIAISLKRLGSRLHLTVADDGRGLSSDFDIEEASSLGLRLIRTLAAQVHGTLTIESRGGTRIRIDCDVEAL